MAKSRFLLLLLILASLLCIPIAFLVGPGGVSRSMQLFSNAPGILYEVRLPRVLLAFFAGGILATSGLLFQCFFHNPLASPYILGITSAAALGAASFLAFHIEIPSSLGFSGLTLGSLFAALLATGVLLLAASRSAFRDSNRLLLFGFALGIVFSSCVTLLEAFLSPESVVRRSRWLLGSLDMASWPLVYWSAGAWIALALLSFARRRALDTVALHEGIAYSEGVHVPKERAVLLCASSLAVALIVSFAGPIGFIGILVPHISRMLVGARHQELVLACALFGGGFLLLSDTVARTIYPPYEIPVGAITALLGGLGFVWILLRR